MELLEVLMVLADTRGASAAEYAIAVVLVALLALGAWELLGDTIDDGVTCAAGAIGGTGGPCGGGGGGDGAPTRIAASGAPGSGGRASLTTGPAGSAPGDGADGRASTSPSNWVPTATQIALTQSESGGPFVVRGSTLGRSVPMTFGGSDPFVTRETSTMGAPVALREDPTVPPPAPETGTGTIGTAPGQPDDSLPPEEPLPSAEGTDADIARILANPDGRVQIPFVGTRYLGKIDGQWVVIEVDRQGNVTGLRPPHAWEEIRDLQCAGGHVGGCVAIATYPLQWAGGVVVGTLDAIFVAPFRSMWESFQQGRESGKIAREIKWGNLWDKGRDAFDRALRDPVGTFERGLRNVWPTAKTGAGKAWGFVRDFAGAEWDKWRYGSPYDRGKMVGEFVPDIVLAFVGVGEVNAARRTARAAQEARRAEAAARGAKAAREAREAEWARRSDRLRVFRQELTRQRREYDDATRLAEDWARKHGWSPNQPGSRIDWMGGDPAYSRMPWKSDPVWGTRQGWVDIEVHGGPGEVFVNIPNPVAGRPPLVSRVPAQEIPRILRENGLAGRPVRLVSCHGGRVVPGVPANAQQIANELRVPVVAADRIVQGSADGSLIVTDGTRLPNGRSDPSGHWHIFLPTGT